MNKERKHIVFLARWYPHRYDPMFGLFVQRHAEAAALFNDITVVYCQPVEPQSRDASITPKKNEQYVIDTSKHHNNASITPKKNELYVIDTSKQKNFEIVRTLENNVDTIRIYYKKPKNKILSLLRFYRANMIGLKLCKSLVETHGRVSRKIDMIHVHILTRLGVIAWIQKLLHKTPYIITEHWSRYLPGNDFGGFFRKLATKIVVRDAKLVTTVTDNLAKAMQNHGLKNDNYVVLPNVVNLDMFHISEKKNNTPCKIIHVSCFEDKSKNISGLLESLKIVEEKGIDFQCTLIGDGMDFDLMKGKAVELQLINKVSFTGLLEGQKLADELASSDFLVLSSNYENMPVVILEALASGLPVVSTNVGGIKEMIDETKGILVEPRNKEALAEAIIKMIETHNDYDPNYLRKSVIEKYGYESVGRFLDSIYS
ncbi:MAG: glycosyltransferase [Bacteroidales bacterium]|nr:glycosyltransferase [Bacteroidales bacterium]